MPFEPELDYDSFGVSISFDDLPRLPALLASFSEPTLRAKRERMREVHRMFLWDDDYGHAFTAVYDAVLAKVRSGQHRGSRLDVRRRDIRIGMRAHNTQQLENTPAVQ
jgi:hypothetical protein